MNTERVTTPVNLGNPEEISINDLANTVKRLTHSRSRIEHKPALGDDPKQRRPDIALATKKLGWKPTTTLEEGLPKMIEYFQNAL